MHCRTLACWIGIALLAITNRLVAETDLLSDPRFSEPVLVNYDVAAVDRATGLGVRAWGDCTPVYSDYPVTPASDYMLMYRSNFPIVIAASLSLPERWRPSDAHGFDLDPIVPRVLVMDGALRAGDFIKMTVHGTRDDGMPLTPDDYVVRASPSAAPYSIYAIAPSAQYIEAGKTLDVPFELDGAHGRGLPPGVYQVRVEFDTSGLPAGTQMPRCHIQNTQKWGLRVLEAKSELDHDKEKLLDISYQEGRDSLRVWQGIEYGTSRYPLNAYIAQLRRGFLLDTADIDRLLLEYDRLAALVKQKNPYEGLPIRPAVQNIDSGPRIDSKEDLKILAEFAHGQVSRERGERLPRRYWVVLDAILYRYHGSLSTAAAAILLSLARDFEAEEERRLHPDGKNLLDSALWIASYHPIIDQIVAAGGLPPSATDVTSPPPGVDTIGQSPHPGATPTLMHAPEKPDAAHGERGNGPPPKYLLILGLAGVVLVIIVAVWAARARRPRAGP